MAQQQSLTELLCSEPQYQELIRYIGYDGVPFEKYESFRSRFLEKYPGNRGTDAIDMIVRSEYVSKRKCTAILSLHIRRHVWPILGPDPKNSPWWAETIKKPEEVHDSTGPEAPLLSTEDKSASKKMLSIFSAFRTDGE